MSQEIEKNADSEVTSGKKTEGIDNPPLTYFAVGATKFWVMSIATFNLYPAYWAFKNWMIIKKHSGRKMTAFWRAFFVVFSNWGLFSWIEASAKEQEVMISWQAEKQASVFFGIVFAGRVLDRIAPLFFFVGFLPPIAIMPIRKTIDELNTSNDPEGDLNRNLNGGNIAIVALSAVLWILALIGLFIPEDALESRGRKPLDLMESSVIEASVSKQNPNPKNALFNESDI